MFKFSDAKTSACAGGEPILFELQDCDWAGAARSLSGRSFVTTIYDASGALATRVGELINDDSGDFARFIFDGTVSDSLRNKLPLYLDVAERLHSGDEQLLSATLTVTRAAPLTTDFATAPNARFIQRVRRLFDPVTHSVDPTYTFAIEVFYSSGVAAPQSNLVADASSASNLILFAAI